MANIIFSQDNLHEAYYVVRQLQVKVSLACFFFRFARKELFFDI